MVRRILGLIMLLIGISGIAVSVIGARIGQQVVDDVGADLVRSLDLLSESLDTIQDSLLLARSSIVDINAGLATLQTTTLNLGTTIDDTQPLLAEIGRIASEDVPDSLDTVQEALPSVVQVAGVVDDTLTTLNNFRIDERILGINIQYDLGIDYSPAVPFDDAIALIGRSLEELPGNLRGLQGQVDVTAANLDTVGQQMQVIADDLVTISGRIEQVDSQLDEYLRIVTRVNDAARQVSNQVGGQLENAKRMVTIITIWLGLSQIAPLYLGWELFAGRRLR